MNNSSFDQYAAEYDSWFLDNENVLKSELALVAKSLAIPGRTLSVGCGSGLFEMLLQKEYDITINEGIEPSEGMASIATKRGVNVTLGTAEDVPFGDNDYDTIMFNGTPSYITDLRKAFDKAFNALKPGGRIIAIDVPKEGSYALLYNLAKSIGSWDHELLQGTPPKHPYPIELVKVANWRTTQEKIELLNETGFEDLKFYQTLTQHPLYSNDTFEYPIEGYTKGDYVAIIAQKPEVYDAK